MALTMLVAILLLAATTPAVSAAPQMAEAPANRAPAIRATARATATIRIMQAVRFGPGQMSGADGAVRRKAEVTDSSGHANPAELLEFQ